MSETSIVTTPLEQEARRTAKYRETLRWTQLLGSLSAVLSWFSHHEYRLIIAAIGGVIGSFYAHKSAKKWWERAEWFKNTETWHEKLDKLPDVRPFPRFSDWSYATWNNRKLLWILVWIFGIVDVVLLSYIAIRALI